jgi:ADP-ribose pyrophosphatase YjhB (NUDIX family)
MKTNTHFAYCPRCASPSLEAHENNAVHCRDCGYLYFHNTAAGVAGIVEVGNTILLVKRAHEPMAGYLDLPGGFVNYHESLEEALIREVREECNIEISNLRYFISSNNTYVYHDVRYFTVDSVFRCTAADVSGLRMSIENTEYSLVEPREIDLDTISFPSVRTAIGRYCEIIS